MYFHFFYFLHSTTSLMEILRYNASVVLALIRVGENYSILFTIAVTNYTEIANVESDSILI